MFPLIGLHNESKGAAARSQARFLEEKGLGIQGTGGGDMRKEIGAASKAAHLERASARSSSPHACESLAEGPGEGCLHPSRNGSAAWSTALLRLKTEPESR